jgi:hypothetical protein
VTAAADNMANGAANRPLRAARSGSPNDRRPVHLLLPGLTWAGRRCAPSFGPMGAEAILRPDHLPVAPGGEAVAELTVKNTGFVVDSFTLSVLGDAAPWAFCDPESISLFPGQEGTVRIGVRLTVESGLPQGPLPFAVRVASSEDPPGSVVEEGLLDVSPMSLVTADMSPRTGRARGMGASRHRVAVDNHGNVPVVVGLVGGDDNDTVHVQVLPPQLQVPPGAAAFAQVRVRARRRFWKGSNVTHKFRVTAHPPGDVPVTSEGTLVQQAVLPSWFLRTVAFGLAGIVAAAALWFGVLRPTVRDAATSAGTAAAQKVVKTALLQQSAGNTAATGSAGAAGGSSPKPSSSKSASKASGKPTATPTPKAGATPKTSTSPGAPATPGAGAAAGASTPKPAPASGSGTTSGSAGTAKAAPAPTPFATTLDTNGATLTPSAKHTIGITDLVMMNPAGGQGMLTLSRNGQTLFSLQLADFREYDLHFITAIMIAAGHNFKLNFSCKVPGGNACTAMVMISGTDAG